MKKSYCIILGIVFLFGSVYAQSNEKSNMEDNVKKSLSIGSAKELAKNFDNLVDLDVGVKKGTFSAAQAEFILKDFFQVHPGRAFQYIHQGGSASGDMRYSIGKYVSDDGSYRVLIRIKQVSGTDKVYNLSFTKE